MFHINLDSKEISWVAFFGVVMFLSIAGFVYLVTRFHKFGRLQRLAKKNRELSWVIALTPIAAIFLFNIINMWATIIVLLHLMLIWIFCDIVGAIINAVKKRKRTEKYYAGVVAIVLTTIYMGTGWFLAHHVFEKDYSLTTKKDLGQDKLRVVMVADLHLGITLDSENFLSQVKKINAVHPDVVLIVGDFVDDDSHNEDMEKACEDLAQVESTYGVYFSFGNHDKGYYNYRDFKSSELRAKLKKNGVKILEDKTELINDSFYIIGRKDRSVRSRKSISELTEDLDKSKYMIVMDHQPNDYSAETKAKVDLVLSGHTHGGHIFPAGLIGKWIGANDRVYGYERRGTTDFIVSSGLSGWAIPFKTGTISEFVVMDIEMK